jgi:hypothetical protein
MDIIHRPIFYLKQNDMSETGFCVAYRWNLLSWAQSIELVPVSETLCVSNKSRTTDNVQKQKILVLSLVEFSLRLFRKPSNWCLSKCALLSLYYPL